MTDSTPANLPYHVRPMERRDIPRVVDVVVAAFMEDELYAWMHPKRREFPLSYRAALAARTRRRMVDRGTWQFVCVPSPHAYDHDKIIGYAMWDRCPGTSRPGSTEAEKLVEKENDVWYQRNAGWAALLEKKMLGLEKYWENMLKLDQSADYVKMDSFIKGFAADDADVFGPLYSGVRHWHLAGVGVHPNSWRKGVARTLIDWGKELAAEESKSLGYSVPITLVASTAGTQVYPKIGFKIVDWKKIPDFATAYFGDAAGPAFIWDPEQTWVEDAPEGTLVDGKRVHAVWTQRALAMLEKK